MKPINILNKLNEEAEYYYKEFSDAGEIDYIEFDDEWEACEYAEKVNKETGNETAVYRMDNDECISLYDAKSDELKEYGSNKSRSTYYIGSNEYGIVEPNDEDSDVLKMYIDDNCYAQEVIPKNWSEDKIRRLAGKISKADGPLGGRDLVKEVEDESKLKESSDYSSEDWKCFEKHKSEFKDYYELPHGILFRDKNKPIYGVIIDGKFMLDSEPIPKDGKYRTDNSTLDTLELKDKDFSPVEDFIVYYVPNKQDKSNICTYCSKKLNDKDSWFIKKYGMCQDCFDKGVE